MNTPSLQHFTCQHAGSSPGTHRMAYHSWGDVDHAHIVVCVHGISRQGRDFDALAQALMGADGQRCRVVSVDVVGRGYSDWLADPMLYQVPQYASDLIALLLDFTAASGEKAPKTIDWVGTSMGGLIGIGVAAQAALQPQLSHILPRKLVLNDIAPVLQPEAIARIGTYLGANPKFDSEQAAMEYLWSISKSFGPHTPEQWRALSLPMLRPEGDKLRLHYDPAIAVPVRASTPEAAAQAEAMLWQLYEAITSDTLLLRGQNSDLISPATAQLMQARGPKAKLVEFAGVGHAPTLVRADQIAAVEQFLWE